MAAESPPYGGTPLQRGSSGSAVAIWQEALGVTADGIFGSGTQAATRTWQRSHGLADHGGVGPVSWAAMFGGSTGDNVSFEGSGWGHGVGLSQYGTQAQAVAGRTYAQILGQYFPGTTITSMATALGSTHWVVSGSMPLWVGLRTAPSVNVRAKAGTLVVCQDFLASLSEGSTGPEVQLLEQRLAALQYNPGTVDQVFDSSTKAAVIAFQQSQGITPAEGLVGPQTRKALWPLDSLENSCPVATTVATGAAVDIVAAVNATSCTVGGGIPATCKASVWALVNQVRQPLDPSNRAAVTGVTGEYAHGVLRIRSAGSLGINAVIQLGVEDYVAGISEVPASWRSAALQAQAIAARSYGLASAIPIGADPSSRPCSCHLFTDSRSQVYKGWMREIEYGGAWAAAAQATTGLVVSHSTASVVKTYYSSANGGRTDDVAQAWGGSPKPYLISSDDPWSLDSASGNPNRFWVVTLTPESLAAKLGFDRITAVQVTSRNTSGAAAIVSVTGTKQGDHVVAEMSGKEVASKAGLKSHYFNVTWTAPPPPFSDIGGSTHETAIRKLYDEGVTNGCTSTEFCPNDEVSRAQIASFLDRAIGFPDPESDHFSDDGGSVHEDSINAMFEAGITNGCGDGRYCPNSELKRREMAVFMVRAAGLEPGGPNAFSDDDGTWYEPYVNALAAAGITGGCGSGRYCPDDSVTRGQMASFLYRAFFGG
jgi:SpoIID/LytB domain protein